MDDTFLNENNNEDKLFESRIDLSLLHASVNQLRKEISHVIIGQEKMIDLMIIAILSDGHVIIEGVPGIAKTLTAKLMARSLAVDFSRIQFTPDLMPSDILGTSVYNTNVSEFEFKKGPVFSNIVLIDEINRAPAKTQSALFEVMEERQITVDGTTYVMDYPFLVFATQNPIEHEGTYRLPEAQLDRFLFKISITYPSFEEENQILFNANNRKGRIEVDEIKPLLSTDQLNNYRSQILELHIEPKLIEYITQIVQRTRNHPGLYLGASPRASLNILTACKAAAAINGRDFVTPEDIRTVVFPVLDHRIYLTPEKELEGVSNEQIISDILHSIEVPK